MKFKTDNIILENTGFVEPKRVIFGKKRDYLVSDGNLGGEELRPDGQWADDIDDLELEPQNQYFETMHCWAWNTIKGITLLEYVKYGTKSNYSERYVGVNGGATPNGGNPHAGCEAIRTKGLIPQETLPWTPNLNTFWEFSSPRPMREEYLNIGKEWLRQYQFKHDWVVWPTFIGNMRYKLGFNVDQIIDANIANMIVALRRSPLGCDVLAWQTRNGMAYKTWEQGSNHWTLIVGYVYGQYWIIYDSYLNCWRKAEWRYPFKWVKEFELNKTNADEIDAEYIKKQYYGRNVKGDKTSAVYFIYSDKKHPYPNMVEYEKICDRWFGTRDFITVRQEALDLVPEGTVMDYDKIASIKPFYTITDSVIT
jgi:hypothetical protein